LTVDQEGEGVRGKGKGERGKGYKPLNSIYVKKEKFILRLLATLAQRGVARYKASILQAPILRYGVYVSLFPLTFNLFPAEGL